MRLDSPERSGGGSSGAETPQGPGTGVKAEPSIWKILYELKLRTFPSTSRFAPETGKKCRLDFFFFFSFFARTSFIISTSFESALVTSPWRMKAHTRCIYIYFCLFLCVSFKMTDIEEQTKKEEKKKPCSLKCQKITTRCFLALTNCFP